MSFWATNGASIISAGGVFLTTLLQGLLPNFRGQNDYQHYINANAQSDARLDAILTAMNKNNDAKPNNTILYVVLGVVVVVLILVFNKKK